MCSAFEGWSSLMLYYKVVCEVDTSLKMYHVFSFINLKKCYKLLPAKATFWI